MEIWFSFCVVMLTHALSDQTVISPQTDGTKVITVREHSEAFLPCQLKATKNHPVVWVYQDGEVLTHAYDRITNDWRVRVEQPSESEWNLHIRDVRHSDQGVYMCFSGSPSLINGVNMLYVQVPPEIMDHLTSSDVSAQEGDTVTLVCNATGNPPPEVSWSRLPSVSDVEQRNELCIMPDGNGQNGAVLIIHNVTRHCSGNYQCMAFNKVEPTAFKVIKVSVEFAPEIYLPNKRIGQKKGMQTILECTVTAFPRAVTYWQKDGRIVTPRSKNRLDERNLEGDNRLTLSLHLLDIDDSDYGLYTCIASNKFGNDAESMFLFTVSANPTVIPSQTEVTTVITVRENNKAYLPCYLEATRDHSVVWMDSRDTVLFINNRRIINNSRMSIERPFVGDWNLFICDVRRSDQGEYRCSTKSGGFVRQSKTFILKVEVPPEIVDHLTSSDVTVQEGDTVTLVCKATGIPPPKVSWFRFPPGSDVEQRNEFCIMPDGVGQNGAFLIIHNVTRHGSGNYQCMAYNKVAPTAFKVVEVSVEFAPEIYLPYKRIGQIKGMAINLECTVTASPYAVTYWQKDGKRIVTSRPKYRLEYVYLEEDNRLTLSLHLFDIDDSDYGCYTCIASNKFGNGAETMFLFNPSIRFFERNRDGCLYNSAKRNSADSLSIINYTLFLFGLITLRLRDGSR